MSQSSQDSAASRRRLVGLSSAATKGADPTLTLPTRARWQLPKTWAIPKSSNSVYVTPFQGDALYNDGDITMNGDYTFTVNTSGMYLVSISFDWADNPDLQVGLRINGISTDTANNPPGTYKKGQLTVESGHATRMGQYDVSSSNCASTSRYTGAWKTGTIGKSAIVSTDVTLATTGIVTLGDVAVASHTGVTSALADGVAALVITAKVIGPDTVRVSIWNSSPTHSVTIPNGTLNVVGMSTRLMSGDAPLGRQLLMSAATELDATNLVWGTFKSTQGGDQLLATPNTFIHFERWA